MTRAESKLRNFGIVAHINAGKTTLTERILFVTGKQAFMGEVDEGTAAMDYLAEEQQRGISITAAFTMVGWRDHRLNVIDTPGHVDFTAEVERCLRVLDGVVVVLDAVRGVESQTEVVWRQADARRVARLVLVNKMDRTGADFAAAVEALKERLRCRPVPILWPRFREGRFAGCTDVIAGRTVWWDEEGEPDTFDQAASRLAVVEACADVDESILADFLHDRSVASDRVHAALRAGTIRGTLVPVLAGAALRNRGVEPLLDAVVRYLPSPLDAGSPTAVDTDSEGIPPPPEREAPVCALVFKSLPIDDELLHCVRIYSGTLRSGDVLRSSGRQEPVPVSALWTVHADRADPVARALPGEVVALQSETEVRTGDTLFTPGHPRRLEPVRFPRPVLTMAVEPRGGEDAAEIERVARRLALDDPTLRVEVDRDTGRLLVSGMGELHLEVFGSRLARRLGAAPRFGRPTVARLETIARPARAVAEWQSPAPPHPRAMVEVQLEPAPGLGPARLVCELSPSPAVTAVCEDLAGRLRSGLAAPYPAVDLIAHLLQVAGDGRGEAALPLHLEALNVACRKAMGQAGPVLLEPIMQFDVVCPQDAFSGVLADLRSRRAKLARIDSGAGGAEVRGTVPMAEMLGYATALRSLTRGLGAVTLTPHGFAPSEGEKEPGRP